MKKYGCVQNAGALLKGIPTSDAESIVPMGYDPLLKKFCLNEQVTYGYEPDFMP